MRRTRHATTLLMAVTALDASAHHSIARVYDSARQSTVSGVVTEFQFINPHPFLIVDVVSETGAAESWRLEMDNRFELARIGMNEDTFVAGDEVVAEGSLARTEPRRLYLRRLERPADGLFYEQVGSSPRLSVESR